VPILRPARAAPTPAHRWIGPEAISRSRRERPKVKTDQDDSKALSSKPLLQPRSDLPQSLRADTPFTRSTTDTEVIMRKALWITVGLGMLAAIIVGMYALAHWYGEWAARSSPYGETAAAYLDAAEEGKPLADLYGACATQAAQSAAQESLDDLEGLGYKIVNSASWGAGTAIVNITFSPSSSDSSPYSFQMQQEGGKWKVCTFTKGHFVVDTE